MDTSELSGRLTEALLGTPAFTRVDVTQQGPVVRAVRYLVSRRGQYEPPTSYQ